MAARGSKRTRDDVLARNDGILVVDDEDNPGTPSPQGHGTKRLSRNMSEKMRRVRMNNHMMELASIVPSIVNAHKKLDKTSILRLTVNFLRLHSGLLEHAVRSRGRRPDLPVFNQLNKVIAEQLDGFLLVIDDSGTILYTSDSMQSYIGVNVEDVLGQPVSRILHPDDVDVVWQRLLSAQQPVSGKNTEYRSAELRLLINTKGQEPGYTKVRITGPLKSRGIGGVRTPMLIGVVQPVSAEHAITEIPSNFDISTTQYTSKHSLNGQFLDADARACLLTGYLQHEMLKLSAYDMIHADDLPFAANAHLTMLRSNGTEIPTSLLRLKAKNGIWVYSATSSHLVIDVWTKKPRYLLSVQNIVSKDIGERALEEQRKLLEDLNLDKLKNSDNPQAVGQTVLEVATELASSECPNPSPSGCSPVSSSPGALSPGALSHGTDMSVTSINRSPCVSPALPDSPEGTICSNESNYSVSVLNSSIMNHSGVCSNGSSPEYSFSSAMMIESSSVNLKGNDSSSDDDNRETAMCSKRMVTPLETDYTSGSSHWLSGSLSPLSDYVNSPHMYTPPGYQDSICSHSSLENRSLRASCDTCLTKSNTTPRSPEGGIQTLFMDDHNVDPLDMDNWILSTSVEEDFQPTVKKKHHSSIEEVLADTSTETGQKQDRLGPGGQCPEQPLLLYLLTCNSESSDVSREPEH